jgi:hypothetical protein
VALKGAQRFYFPDEKEALLREDEDLPKTGRERKNEQVSQNI